MNKDIFSFKDYKAYINHKILLLPKGGRGARIALAKAISSPVSHISQVLNGNSHLSYEQAEAMNEFLGHTEEEADFFLLLIQYARAGSTALSKRLHQQILRALQKRTLLKDRLGVKTEISSADQATFYSSWIYGAIHVMVSIPKFQTREAIAAYLGLTLKHVGEILEFLMSLGLVIKDSSGYVIGKSRIHLGNDSPMISKFHTNWRMKAIQSFEKEDFKNNLHYSSVVTLSDNDFLKIKSLLVNYIAEIKTIIKDSKEEGVHSFSIDFFKM
ncbi:MAG: TIGR02147 family protein [Bdellovibrionota bacterium]